MRFARAAAPLRCRPPFPLLAVALCAVAGAVSAQVRIGGVASGSAVLAMSTEPDTLATAALAIANDGGAGRKLAFRITPSAGPCEAPTPVPWLMADPATGEIAAGAVATVSVYASGFAAASRRRTAFLCIGTGDADQSPSAVSVVLTIGGDASRGDVVERP